MDSPDHGSRSLPARSDRAPRSRRSRQPIERGPRSRFALACAAFLAVGCGRSTPREPTTAADPSARTTTTVDASSTNTGSGFIRTFAVSPENLSVDKISMREGAAVPDGTRDLVFTTTLDGPFDALYLGTCTAKGETLHSFLADTVIGREELPSELASVVDVGSMTEWIAVAENGKFLNHENGHIALPSGTHHLTLYVPNTGLLRSGTFLRLYGRTPQGALVRGPVVPY